MRWVVFDCGEVIGRPNGVMPAPAGVLGVPVEDFARAYWAARRP
ncbi:hypothetical protein ACIGNX_06980 [Actinosynnema sp. NPDC053489]